MTKYVVVIQEDDSAVSEVKLFNSKILAERKLEKAEDEGYEGSVWGV